MENPLQKENQYTHIYVIFEEWVSHKFSSQEPYSHSPAIIMAMQGACYMIWSQRYLFVSWAFMVEYSLKIAEKNIGCHFDSCVCIYLCPPYYMDRWALVL
jgi:hypothetical protein